MFSILAFVNYLTRVHLNLSNKYFCELLYKVRVKRNEYKIRCDQYDREYLNPYCSGVINIFRTDLIAKLYESALNIDYSFINDIYVGFLTESLDLDMISIKKHVINDRDRNQNDVLLYKSIQTVEDLLRIWNFVVKKREFALNGVKNLDFFQKII